MAMGCSLGGWQLLRNLPVVGPTPWNGMGMPIDQTPWPWVWQVCRSMLVALLMFESLWWGDPTSTARFVCVVGRWRGDVNVFCWQSTSFAKESLKQPTKLLKLQWESQSGWIECAQWCSRDAGYRKVTGILFETGQLEHCIPSLVTVLSLLISLRITCWKQELYWDQAVDWSAVRKSACWKQELLGPRLI